MSYTVFARKYRPQTFDDVVGQEHITRTLKNAIELRRLAHAYIFVGPRGTGKTSTARILAKSLNCQAFDGPTITPCGVCDACKEITGGNSLDVLEFDAASNTQVDKVRELIIENVKYAPTRGRYKVYIVDEVHMLSTSSFNALLKTLEEPPEHVKFVFATTDVQKVPTTILSRCQRFDLKRIPGPLIAGHLLHIAEQEELALSQAAADTIAHGAEGGMRDAESMLDQLVAFCGNTIEESDVLTIFGLTAHDTVTELAERIISAETAGALAMLHEESEAGRDLTRLMGDLISHFRNLLVAQADAGSLQGEHTAEAVQELLAQASRVRPEKLLELIEQFAGAEARMRWSPNRKMHFEIALIRAVQMLKQATLGEVIETLSALRSGGELPPIQAPTPRSNPPAPKPKPEPSATAQPITAPAPPAQVPEPAPRAKAPEAVPVAKVQEVAPKPADARPASVRPAPEPLITREVPPWEDQPAPAAAPTSAGKGKKSVPLAPRAAASGTKAESGGEDNADESSPFSRDEDQDDPVMHEKGPRGLIPEPLSAVVQVAEPPQISEDADEEADADEPSPGEPVQGELLRRWPELLAAVRKQRPLIVSWVQEGTLLSVEKGTALLGFPPEKKLASEYCLQAGNRSFLEGLLTEMGGETLVLKTLVKEGLAVQEPIVYQPETPIDPMDSFKNDPLIQRALEIFRAQIQPA